MRIAGSIASGSSSLQTTIQATYLDGELVPQYRQAAAQLASASVPGPVVTLLSTYDAGKAAVMAQLQAQASDITRLARGYVPFCVGSHHASLAVLTHTLPRTRYCASSTSTQCDTTSDCPGGASCLSIGVRRCREDPTVSCTSDANCGASDECLVDATRVAQLQDTLLATAVPSTANISAYFTAATDAIAVPASSAPTALFGMTIPATASVIDLRR